MNAFTIIICAIIVGICGFNRKASANDQMLVQAFESANRARVDVHGDMVVRRKRYAEAVSMFYANLRKTLHHNREKRSFILDYLINRATEMPSSTPSSTPSAPPLPTNPQTSPTTPTTAATTPAPTKIYQRPIIKLPKFPIFSPWGKRSRSSW